MATSPVSLWGAVFFLLLGTITPLTTHAAEEPPLLSRVRGLLYGAAIGDALGGPVEFQSSQDVARLPQAPKVWKPGERLDESAKTAAKRRLRMRPYAPLRTQSASYGQWGENAPPGTVTDDTRHKLVLLDALHGPLPIDAASLAKAYLDWPNQPLPGGRADLIADWLEEWRFAAAWVLGRRDPASARPPERMWQGLPTCCGQMTSLPLAALYPGKPAAAYQACYQLSFFDNGWGKDLNAALVAGLATALAVTGDDLEAKWSQVLQSMRQTDPYHYADIRYTNRQVDRWLDLAAKLAADARSKPAALFKSLEETFAETIKWEAQVPFVVAFSCLSLADYDPLTALQLSIEWGHDTDSYAQVVGAFIGALHGDAVFPPHLRQPVHQRLVADFGVNFSEEAAFLLGLQDRPEEVVRLRP